MNWLTYALCLRYLPASLASSARLACVISIPRSQLPPVQSSWREHLSHSSPCEGSFQAGNDP
jgi:hypothetical protein